MIRKIMIPIMFLTFITCALAQEIKLKNDITGEVTEPFKAQTGEKVAIGKQSYSVIVTVKKKYGALSMSQKLELTVIPVIKFRGAKISDVLDFLKQASFEYSPSSDPKYQGVNMIMRCTKQDLAKISDVTFDARNMTLKEALRAICSAVGLKYRIDGSILWIEAKPRKK